PRVDRVFMRAGIAAVVEAHFEGAISSVPALIGRRIAERIALLEPSKDGLHRRGHGDAVAGVDHFAAALPAYFLHVMKPWLRVRQEERSGMLQISHSDAVNRCSGLLRRAHHLRYIA